VTWLVLLRYSGSLLLGGADVHDVTVSSVAATRGSA
jgi:hypothetical protein